MPSPSFSVSTEIPAAPATVFAYVSDLTKHGEWSANALTVTALDPTPIGVGKPYRSHAVVGGRAFDAALRVTAYTPPTLFAFSGQDNTGKFDHTFTFEKTPNGTRVTRTVSFNLSLPQYLFYLIALNRVRLPAARTALGQLKTKFG